LGFGAAAGQRDTARARGFPGGAGRLRAVGAALAIADDRNIVRRPEKRLSAFLARKNERFPARR
jgi:hypothetical protein